jgi:CheY-like chemotaxis protein
VVDDEDVVRNYAVRVLEGAGCRVLAAADGDEALRLLAEHPGLIEAVVLDLTMPGMPARALLETMRETSPELRVLLCSGYSPDATVLEELQSIAFLPKPYTPRQLLAALRATFEAPAGVSESAG